MPRIYPGGEQVTIGQRRFEVEWQTVKPEAASRVAAAEAKGEYDELDPDRDIITHARAYPTKNAALRAARGIVNLGRTAYGTATVTEQVAEWFEERYNFAEWCNVNEPEYVD